MGFPQAGAVMSRCHEDCPETGALYELGGNWISKVPEDHCLPSSSGSGSGSRSIGSSME